MIAMLKRLYIVFTLFHSGSRASSSLMVRPIAGCVSCGAISCRGCSTKLRRCSRGWGTVRRSLFITLLP